MVEIIEREMLDFAEENCQCYRCPTYISARPPDGARADIGDQVVKTYQPKALGSEEIAYCIKGKSKIISEESTCNCTGTGFAGCPVRLKFKLRNKFYCIRGSEKGK
jgi:hypothetical protein